MDFGKFLSRDLLANEQACLDQLLELRKQLKQNLTEIEFKDFGASVSHDHSPESLTKRKRVKDIYINASIPRSWAVFLFQLVRWLHPKKVLELGTNLGVGAAYIQAALDLNAAGSLVSIEGSKSLSDFASDLLRRHCKGKVEIVTGPFSQTLKETLERHGPISLAFIDGHHTEEAAYNYYTMLKTKLSPRAIVVFDDIEPWSPVHAAWKRIIHEETYTSSIYLLKKGLIFHD